MADITRTITVELTKVFRDAKEGDQTDFGTKIDLTLNGILGHCFDQIKIGKIQDFVFPDQPKAPKLTKQERVLCEIVQNGWIARDNNKKLYWYNSKPLKGGATWYNTYHTCLDLLNVLFMFIEWEDDEPWSVEDLLKLEVEDGQE